MKFIMNRNRTVPSILGHTIEFIKGVPVHVPPELWAEVQAAGAIPEDELPEEEKVATREPSDPVARKAAIFDAFTQIKLRNKREDFAATGVPHAKTLIAHMGFEIDNKERDMLWNEFKLVPPAEAAEAAPEVKAKGKGK